jgi:ATP-dependent exoDNAse (exonuclease V) alpha subunit
MFAPGQAYVAISRAKTWDSLTITALDFDSIKTDEQVIVEYQRLQEKYDKLLSTFGF